MESRIEIQVNSNCQPIVEIKFTSSTDVRDKLIGQFLQELGAKSKWCTIQCISSFGSTDVKGVNTWHIRPVSKAELGEQIRQMQAEYDSMQS